MDVTGQVGHNGETEGFMNKVLKVTLLIMALLLSLGFYLFICLNGG